MSYISKAGSVWRAWQACPVRTVATGKEVRKDILCFSKKMRKAAAVISLCVLSTVMGQK